MKIKNLTNTKTLEINTMKGRNNIEGARLKMTLQMIKQSFQFR